MNITKSLALTTIAAIVCCTAAFAQSISRSEILTYSMRDAADRRISPMADTTLYIPFVPTEVAPISDAEIAITQSVELPYAWSDGVVGIHLENIGLAARLVVNGDEVGYSDDPLTPAEYDITKYLRQGINQISVVASEPKHPELQSGVAEAERPKRGRLEGSYLFKQKRKYIADIEASITPDSTGNFAWLNIAAVVDNRYNFEEDLTVGFDIYDPTGDLLDFSVRPVVVSGQSRDTIRFRTNIYNADRFRWSPEAPRLYRLMLLTKNGQVIDSYLPIHVAYTDREVKGGKLYNFGKEVKLRAKRYNATTTEEDARAQMAKIKAAGYNTLRPDYPQPNWYYTLADVMGLYVVDQANINAPESAGNRAIGGTPANDPSLLPDYLARVQSSYFRTRHHPSVVAYSLGGNSGNGYNMYKAYEWLKGREAERGVIYDGAEDEWNSDIIEIK